MKKISVRDICYVAIFAAILSVLSILQIPTPSGVPFTLQTFAVALCGFVLLQKFGAAATFIYVLLGLVGVPVYAGFSAGPGVLFGTSGGYLWGFILMAFFCGFGMKLGKKMHNVVGHVVALLLGVVGLACCHILGIIQLKFVLSCTWAEAALWGSIPFLLKDFLSVIGAYVIALVLRKALKAAHLLSDEA